jgi:recombinational DNA repair protein RecR
MFQPETLTYRIILKIGAKQIERSTRNTLQVVDYDAVSRRINNEAYREFLLAENLTTLSTATNFYIVINCG